jgi:hypothetical protein
MLRFGSGLGAGLAAAAAQLGLLEDRLAAAAARVWAAGSLHQLSARWLRVVSRVRPHIVLSMLQDFGCLPPGMRLTHSSWQAVQKGTSGQQCEQPWLAAPWAEPSQKSAACAAAEESVLASWLSTCTGDGRGGWQTLTAVGADEEGRNGGELQLLPCLRRGQRDGALRALVAVV